MGVYIYINSQNDFGSLMPLFYRGRKHRILLCEDAEESLQKVTAAVSDRFLATLFAAIKRYGDTGHLKSPQKINYEGHKIGAFKGPGGLRAYFWFNQNREIVISHFIIKKRRKLKTTDKTRAIGNRKQFEECGDEKERN